MPTLEAITIHAEDPSLLAPFWSTALRLDMDEASADAIRHQRPLPAPTVRLGRLDGLHVWISSANEVPPARGRIHLDVRQEHPGDEDRLVSLGATLVWRHPEGHWTVLADPEGNRFCLVPGAA
jgi:hypothetical protein